MTMKEYKENRCILYLKKNHSIQLSSSFFSYAQSQNFPIWPMHIILIIILGNKKTFIMITLVKYSIIYLFRSVIFV